MLIKFERGVNPDKLKFWGPVNTGEKIFEKFLKNSKKYEKKYYCPPASRTGTHHFRNTCDFAPFGRKIASIAKSCRPPAQLQGIDMARIVSLHPRTETNQRMARVRGFARFARKSPSLAHHWLPSAELRQIVNACSSTRVFGCARAWASIF